MKTIIIIFLSFNIINSIPLTCPEALTATECKDIINGIHECIWYENTCYRKETFYLYKQKKLLN